MNFNLHTHTTYCDGKSEPEAYVARALELGFHTLGFSGHAPVPFENHFAIPEEHLQDYFREIRNLKMQHRANIQILLALEIDFIPGITDEFSSFVQKGNLDYTIGGVHLIRNLQTGSEKLWFIDGPLQETYDNGLKEVFNGHPRRGVEAYYDQVAEMIQTQKPDILAHLDKIKMHNKDRWFSEEEGWYRDKVWNLLKTIQSEKNVVVEVNTRGLYKNRCDTFFPGPTILEQLHHLNIPVTISSDAHKPEELNEYLDDALAILRDIGFRELTLFEEAGKRRILNIS